MARTGPRRSGRRPASGAPWVAAALVVSLFAVLVARLGQVQLVEAPLLTTSARTVNTRVVIDQATRGRILDRTGKPLADNTFSMTVTVQRQVLVESDDEGRALIEAVAAALGRPVEALWAKTKLCGTQGAPAAPACFNGSPYVPIPIATDVPAEAGLSLIERPEKYPGVGVSAAVAREYPGPDRVNAAHLLGYVSRSTAAEVAAGSTSADDVVGRSGLEGQYDEQLRGRNGATTVRVDPRGIVTGTLSTVHPVAGSDVRTYLDAALQARVEAILVQTLASARAAKQVADSAAAVVMDVDTGAIVAAASVPTYDPNLFTGGIGAADYRRISGAASGLALRSRISTEVFPPASTFKVISVPAAVSAGFDLHGRYDCSPSYTVGGRTFQNFESRGYGLIDLHRTLVVSCDTVFYRFAEAVWNRLGGLAAGPQARDPFSETARAFGIGTRTGVDLPGESAGTLPDRAWKRDYWEATRTTSCARAASGYPDVARTDRARAAYLTALAAENCAEGYQWRPGDEVNFSIGQGDTKVTPLQMAVVYAAVANGGTLVTPRIAEEVVGPAGGATPVPPGPRKRLPVSAEVLAYMRSALADVTRPGGSAGSAFTGYPGGGQAVAGKTGTGEVFGKQATAWFVGYGPITKPKYVVSVVVSQGGSGSKVAAPAVRRIFDALRASGLL